MFLGDFLALTLARQVAETLNLAVRNDLVSTIAAAIKADVKDTGLSAENVAVRIAEAASEGRRKGVPITKFYFADMKWRNGSGRSEQQKVSASTARAERTAANILDGIAAHVGKRN
jgi:hypothetical protein